jgi:hypothetical protein
MLTPRRVLLLASMFLVLFAVGPLSAQPQPLVTFFDLTDVVTATGQGTAGPLSGEQISFSLSPPFPAALLNGFELRIVDGSCTSGPCSLSDLLSLDLGNFLFLSDAETPLSILSECPPSLCIPETGGLQDVTRFFFAGTGAPTSGLIFFQSDVERTVPAPATLVLLGTGLAGLAGITWRRQRRT